MFKLFISAFFLQSLFCYSQIDQKELEKLPPEIREKVLQTLEQVKEKDQSVFTEEDFIEFEKKRAQEEAAKKLESETKKAVTVKLPEAGKVKPVDKEKVLKLVKQLGANHYKARKDAKVELSKMNFTAVPLLKEQLSATSDPEISESLKEIILLLTHRLHIGQLSESQKKIVKLPFKEGAVLNPKVTAEFYNKNGHFIIDIGLTRLVFGAEVKEVSSTYSRTVNMQLEGNSGGGGSSSSNGFKIYDYSYESGTGYWNICGHSFTVSNYELEISKQKLKLKSEHPQILFFDKNNKVIGILDIK